MNLKKRAQIIADTRALLDWLEAHPDVPMPDHGVSMQYCVFGDDATELAEVTRIATAAGVPVTDNGDPVSDTATHFTAAVRIGTASYKAVAITQAAMDSYNRHMEAFHQGGES